MPPNRRAAPLYHPAEDDGGPALAASEGRRIRWERHPDNADLLVVRDADSGEVIALVSSLLDLDWNEA